MIGKDVIGWESKPVMFRIESDAVRRFTEAAGISFNNRVPPTFVGAFMTGNIGGIDLMRYVAIHGEQKFTYYQPVNIGDCITYTCRIKDVSKGSGRLGKMFRVIIETTGCNPMREDVYKINSTIIFIERRPEDEASSGLSG